MKPRSEHPYRFIFSYPAVLRHAGHAGVIRLAIEKKRNRQPVGQTCQFHRFTKSFLFMAGQIDAAPRNYCHPVFHLLHPCWYLHMMGGEGPVPSDSEPNGAEADENRTRSEDRLKITLKYEDLRALSLSFDDLDYAEMETRRVIWELLDEASRQTWLRQLRRPVADRGAAPARRRLHPVFHGAAAGSYSPAGGGEIAV